jgi:MOSC domain-containing protein YiiM
MKLLSLNGGAPRALTYRGKEITTGIFKEPVAGAVMLRQTNLDGDGQADLSVHGGESKAVYAYPSEHYEFWRRELPEVNLPWGAFGENLTTEGLTEDSVHIGDRFRIGEAELMVTEPRFPCYKLGIKFGREDIIEWFLNSRRSGFYFAVVREGKIAAGDAIELVHRDAHGVTIADIVRVHSFDKDDLATLRRAVAVKALPERWRIRFQQRIETLAR